MITKNDMANITEVVGRRFNELPDELKENPVALMEWTLTNTFKLISAIEEKAILMRHGSPDLILDSAEQNPHLTGHQLIAASAQL